MTPANIPDTLALALRMHSAGNLAEAEKVYHQILETEPVHADAIHLLGVIAHQRGQHDSAIGHIRKAIEINPAVAEFHNNIGEAYRALRKFGEAESHYRQAISLKPNYAEPHCNLGAVRLAQSRAEEAIACFRQALLVQPDYPEADVDLGTVLQSLGRLDEAVLNFRCALSLKPNYSEAHAKLGTALWSQGQFDEATTCFRRALAIRPNDEQTLEKLGIALREQGKHSEAIPVFERMVALNPQYFDAYNWLGVCYVRFGRIEEAAVYYQKAIDLNPSFYPGYKNLGGCLKDQGKLEEAEARYRQALALVPSDGLRILIATLLPPIFKSKEHLMQTRQRYQQQVAGLLQQDLKMTDPYLEVGATNFYLSYQGLDDRDLLCSLARVYEKACPSLKYVAPHCAAPRPSSAGGKIKIGFVSDFFYDHTIGKLMRGIIARLSREAFTVTLFISARESDEMTEFIVRHADRTVVLPSVLDAARQAIAREQLDILFYPDIGMDPFTYFLAFARLAPVQCVTWGHPDTTGIPAIDYFISSELLEPKGAERYYSERLIRLAHLPTYYYKPDVSAGLKSRKDFGLREDGVLYMCPQSLFKFHPDFDAVLAGILRGHPEGHLAVIEGQWEYFTDVILRRFEKTIPEAMDRIQVVPRQNGRDFISLLSLADVILDPVKWSGGNTTFEALSFGIPIVTMPSEFMRGRVTYACYKQMGVMDCVAETAEEYVRLAVRLGTDPAYCAKIKAKLLASNGVLYENGEAVRELERFLVDAVRGKPAGEKASTWWPKFLTPKDE